MKRFFSHQQKVLNGTSEVHGRPSKENYQSDVFFLHFCILPPGDQDISSKGVKTAGKCDKVSILNIYIEYISFHLIIYFEYIYFYSKLYFEYIFIYLLYNLQIQEGQSQNC